MKIKILYVNGGIMNRGGIESYMMNYYRHIDKEQFQIDFVVHGYQRGAFDEEIEKSGSKIYRLPVKSKEPLHYRSRLKRVLSETHCDIIHSHVDAMSCWILKVAKECNIPVRIAHSHNTEHLTTNKVKYLVNELARKNITKYTTQCFACSEAAGRWLFGERDYDVIRNAIDLNQFSFSVALRDEVRKELGLEKDNFVVGHVGRFDDQKNHKFLVDVFHKALQQNPKMTLLLVGDGRLRQEIEEKVRGYDISDKVIFLGNREDVYRIYSAMDIAVLPSLFEGLPVTLIEAQANGLTSLVSDVVTRDVNHGDAVTFLELSDEIWVKNILEKSQMRSSRCDDYPEELKKDGYDIVDATRKLEKKYRDLVK